MAARASFRGSLRIIQDICISRYSNREASTASQIKIQKPLGFMAARCKAGRNKVREIKPNPKKMMIASKVKDVFDNNEMVAVFQYNDMNTTEWENLRHNLSRSDIKVKVFPNKVTHKALENSIYQEISPLFLCTTCIMYSKEPIVKPLIDAVKKQPKLELLGAKVQNRLLSRTGVRECAKLPPLKELHVNLVQLLQKPASQLNYLLQQNQRLLTQNLFQYVEQEKEEC
ncbi:39S ribosomal protein L10, mitochondrial-like [Actinia tenebrosa]|uniref:Large ribosomal subunit protein uL10m n=1 Tax=Actinia tenebrosa TaxID=6105 RepID=A0A6P8HTW4_ACTTE|nr:39S ribosomal protein L10, mitochondrial-like [Actinia tenebrosa]